MRIFENLISVENSIEIYKQILYNRKFTYGEVDRSDTTPTGMIFNMSCDDELYTFFYSILIDNNIINDSSKLQRAYVNLFFPNEKPYFHEDGDVTTYLFYINPPTSIDEGGETQFLIDGEIVAFLPKPGRMIEFDGKLLHKATSFRNIPRITLAMKFWKFSI
jgi:hypothetical protein